jgi:hypothetical protein
LGQQGFFTGQVEQVMPERGSAKPNATHQTQKPYHQAY